MGRLYTASWGYDAAMRERASTLGMRGLAVAVLLVLSACPAPTPARPTTPTPTSIEQPPRDPDAPILTPIRVATAADLPDALLPGTFRLHLIDVGTGLAVLIQGVDFALLYDAGTNDAKEKPSRVLAYLAAVLGPSGDSVCGNPSQGPKKKIDHVVLSHPHLDHASALDTILHCYEVGDYWDSGKTATTKFYLELLDALTRTPLVYHTAADQPQVAIPNWKRYSEGDTIPLGEGATFTILHANPKASDANAASLVITVQLGRTNVLLVGDAESGSRQDPSYPAGDVEEHLIDHHGGRIRSHILQVGHHGSKTSSRRAFIEAVKPMYALVSSGPKTYGKDKIVLPDKEVIEELVRSGATILRTDERDGNCPIQNRIGDNDDGPGGCDTWVITIGP
jgi:competence protein ComEC